MWHVSIVFYGTKVELPGGWKTKGEAEWSIGQWKQKWNMTGDPFVYECIKEVPDNLLPSSNK